MDAQADFYLDRPLVIAHRGASAIAPENTLAAFRAAVEVGADGIELDVTSCASGQIVVIHDDTVDRTTDGHGRVADLPYDALRPLDAGSWFGPAFAGEAIPRLEQVLDLVGDQARINIEIKRPDRRQADLEAGVARLVRERGLEDRVVVSSFYPLALIRMRRLAPALKRGFLYSKGLPSTRMGWWLRPLMGLSALHPHHRLVDARFVRRAHAKGYGVNVWTVDEPAEMRRLVAAGVDGIITNRPAALVDILDTARDR